MNWQFLYRSALSSNYQVHGSGETRSKEDTTSKQSVHEGSSDIWRKKIGILEELLRLLGTYPLKIEMVKYVYGKWPKELYRHV